MKNKLENIISGYKINEDDANWLRGVLHPIFERTSKRPKLSEAITIDQFAELNDLKISVRKREFDGKACFYAAFDNLHFIGADSIGNPMGVGTTESAAVHHLARSISNRLVKIYRSPDNFHECLVPVLVEAIDLN